MVPFRTHTDPIFKELEVLPIEKVYSYSVTIFMLKFEKNDLPPIFNEFFIRNREVHQYSTRQRNQLHVPKARLSAYQKTLKYVGVSVWNNMQNKLNFDCSISRYKIQLKQFLLLNEVPVFTRA